MAKKVKNEAPQDKKIPAKKSSAIKPQAVKPPVAVTTSSKTPAVKKTPTKTAKKPAVKKAATKKKPKTSRVRKPYQTRPTAREIAAIEERRYLVWDLYKAGASYRQISEHLKKKKVKGASIGSVFTDLQYCLALQHDELELSVKDHIENEIAIINDVQFNFYPLMNNSKTFFDARKDAAGIVLNCVKERAKLRNLYKAKEIKLNVDDELARLLGLDPEELPETDVN